MAMAEVAAQALEVERQLIDLVEDALAGDRYGYGNRFTGRDVGAARGCRQREVADQAAERAVESWLAMPAGRDLLERAGVSIAGRLGRSSADLPSRAAQAVRAWQGHVLDLVRSEGAERRTLARAASFGVNSLGVLLMLAAFSATGGGTVRRSMRALPAPFG